MPIVTIGTQQWDTQNLDVDCFADGTPIQHAQTELEWQTLCSAGTPAWRYYNDDSSNGELYNKLYNWYVVSSSLTSKQIVPNTQFKVPTTAQWNTLVSYLAGEKEAGHKLKNTENWGSLGKDIDGNGDNSALFYGNPGGFMRENGEFFDLEWSANWWSATSASATAAPGYRAFWQNRSLISLTTPMTMGLSIRLIASGSFTGSIKYNPSEDYDNPTAPPGL